MSESVTTIKTLLRLTQKRILFTLSEVTVPITVIEMNFRRL